MNTATLAVHRSSQLNALTPLRYLLRGSWFCVVLLYLHTSFADIALLFFIRGLFWCSASTSYRNTSDSSWWSRMGSTPALMETREEAFDSRRYEFRHEKDFSLTPTLHGLTMHFEACTLIQVACRPDKASPKSLVAGAEGSIRVKFETLKIAFSLAQLATIFPIPNRNQRAGTSRALSNGEDVLREPAVGACQPSDRKPSGRG